MAQTTITINAALEFDKAENRPRIYEHEGKNYYNIQAYSNNIVLEEILIPADTEPSKIRQAIKELAEYRQKIVEQASRTVVITNFN